MKKQIWVSAVLLFSITLCLFFTACGGKEVKWSGYAGTMEGYEYRYEEGRNREWEEDVLALSENFLRYHPFLTEAESMIYVEDKTVEWRSLFKEEVRQAFLREINSLIPEIEELSDKEILFELQKAVAVLGDAHSKVALDTEPFFPVSFQPFWEDGKWELRAVVLPEEWKEVLYARLISINDIPVQEVLDRIDPYLSYENTEWAIHQCVNDVGGEWIVQRDMLERTGVLGDGDAQAQFTFQDEQAQEITVTLSAVTLREYFELDLEYRNAYATYSLLYADWVTANYRYQMMPEEDMVYIRIARFEEDAGQSLLQMSEELIKEIGNAGGVEKAVVDLRNNVGGGKIEGYDRFFQALTLKNIGAVYVLIDEGTFSRGVMAAGRIRQEIDGAIVVGTPAGEGSFFTAHSAHSYQTLPNSGVSYYIGEQADIVDAEESYDAFMPDIVVYPTLEDYQNGVDTVLSYVMQAE